MLFTITEMKRLESQFRPNLVIYYLTLLLVSVIILGSVFDPQFMLRWAYNVVLWNTGNINTATFVLLFGSFLKLIAIFLLGNYAQYLHRYIHVRIYGKKRKV